MFYLIRFCRLRMINTVRLGCWLMIYIFRVVMFVDLIFVKDFIFIVLFVIFWVRGLFWDYWGPLVIVDFTLLFIIVVFFIIGGLGKVKNFIGFVDPITITNTVFLSFFIIMFLGSCFTLRNCLNQSLLCLMGNCGFGAQRNGPKLLLLIFLHFRSLRLLDFQK